MEKINYIKEEDFEKLTKKQKLSLPCSHSYEEIEIDKLVIIPTNKKNDSYCLGEFFAHTKGNGWWKPMTYDCWSITTDIYNPATPKYQILKGDFENGGVQIFGFMDEHHKAYISYGGQIIIKRA